MRRRIGSTIVCAAGCALALLCSTAPQARAQAPLRQASRTPALGGAEVLPALDASATPSPQPAALFPLTVPAYTSYAGVPGGPTPPKIYLDFDGDVTQNWGGYIPGTTPAYDVDGDPTTFSQEELNNIHEIFLRAAEAFSPFYINVTTVNPGVLRDGQAVRIVIGGDGKNGADSYWAGVRAGGISFVGSFNDGFYPNTSYVFPGNLKDPDTKYPLPKYTAVAIAHEAGHTFGLDHQRAFDAQGNLVDEYNHGTPDRSPYMGFGYFSTRTVWFNGPSGSALSFQDDPAIISDPYSNGFGYRPDDNGNSIATATPLTLVNSHFNASGVIETTGDHDFLSFSVDQDSVAIIQLTGAPFGAMLDPSFAIYDSNGLLIDTVANLGSESWARGLAPGTYDIDVFGMSDLNDRGLGSFVLGGELVAGVPEPSLAGSLLLVPLLLQLRRRRN